MDSYTLMQKYPNVSREELDKIRAISHYPSFSDIDFERSISSLDREKEEERLNGKRDFLVGPSVQVVSVRFLSTDDIDQKQSFTVYGHIYAESCDTSTGKTIVHDFYNRERGDAQVLESNESLTLITPDFSYWPFESGMPLEHTKLFVDMYVMDNNLSAEIPCGDHETDLEKVIEEHIYCDFGSLVLRYSITPFAVRGHVVVHFFRKDGCTQGSLDVKGIIVVRSSNTFGGYTLFHKKSNEFKRVETDVGRNAMKLSRCWVDVLAHSTLIIEVDLSEKGTEREILKQSIELQVEYMMSYDVFIVGDLIINVSVAWISPMPFGRCIEEESGTVLDNESSADDMSSLEASKEESDDEYMGEACILNVPSHLSRPCIHRTCSRSGES